MLDREPRTLPASVRAALRPESLSERLALSRATSKMRRLRGRSLAAVRRLREAVTLGAVRGLARVTPASPVRRPARSWARLTRRLTERCVRSRWPASAHQSPLLAARIRSSDLARAVLWDQPRSAVGPAELLSLQQLDVLRPLVRPWLRRSPELLGPVADYIHERLVLDGPAAVGAAGTGQCLAVLPEVVAILSRQQLVSLADVVADLASAPIDPYAPAAPATGARTALAEMFAARPELDDTALPPGSLLSSGRVNAYLAALAVGVHRDLGRLPARLLQACVNTSLGAGRIEELAAAASVRPALGSLHAAQVSPSRPWGWLGRGLTTAAAWAVPVIGSALVLLALRSHPPAFLAEVSPEVTLAVFALIATVHALIITLSREHLPRRMARVAATPRILISAYATSIIAIAASSVDLAGETSLEQSTVASWTHSLNGLVAASVLVAVLLLAGSTMQVLRLADPVAATTAFGRSSVRALARSGTRFGSLQARALELRTVLGAMPNVRVSTEQVPGEVAELLRAPERGFFVPRNTRLRRLVETTQFREGMSLRVHAPLGAVVARLDPVVALVPTPAQRVDRRTRRTAIRLTELERTAWLDRARGVTASLYDLAIRTSREGDQGGAQRAASVCLELCYRHLDAMSNARAKAYERARARVRRRARDGSWRAGRGTWQPSDSTTSREAPPPSPLVADLVAACVGSLTTEADAEREIATYVLSGLLAFGDRDDRVPAAVVNAVLSAAQPRDERQTRQVLGLLRRCALANLEMGLADDCAFALFASSLARMGSKAVRLDELTVTLAAASRIDSGQVQRRLADHLSDADHDIDSRLRAYYVIGAAALDAGAVDTAFTCVSQIATSGLVLPTNEWLDLEASLVTSGSYLGHSPRDALAQFASLAAGLAPLLSATRAL
jgi:hypothetical protein